MAATGEEFLLAEYKASMDMILKIDDRRGVFLNYYAVIFIAGASISLTVLARSDLILTVFAKLSLLVLFLSIAGIGLGVGLVLNSERKANVRYRQRINRIRALLCVSNELDLKEYLFKEQHEPVGIGRTLKVVFTIIGVQIFIALLAALAVALYFDPTALVEVASAAN